MTPMDRAPEGTVWVVLVKQVILPIDLGQSLEIVSMLWEAGAPFERRPQLAKRPM